MTLVKRLTTARSNWENSILLAFILIRRSDHKCFLKSATSSDILRIEGIVKP